MFFFKASQLQQTLVNSGQGFGNAWRTVLVNYFKCQQISGCCFWRSISTKTVAELGEPRGFGMWTERSSEGIILRNSAWWPAIYAWDTIKERWEGNNGAVNPQNIASYTNSGGKGEKNAKGKKIKYCPTSLSCRNLGVLYSVQNAEMCFWCSWCSWCWGGRGGTAQQGSIDLDPRQRLGITE